MTGATSGIGQLIWEQLARERPDMMVIGAGRNTGSEGPSDLRRRVELGSLKDTRRLAEDVLALRAPIPLLILAAGHQGTRDTDRSADGYELTFAVNVLANVVLLDTLIGAGVTPSRVIIFSSATHDPAKRAGLPPPRHCNPAILAEPANDKSSADDSHWTRGARAYSTSKLAVAMLAQAYAREQSTMRIDAIDPQLTPGTGLARHQHGAVRLLWHSVLPLLAPLVPFMNRPSAVARAAVALAFDDGLAMGSGRYVEVRRGRLVERRSSAVSYDSAAQDRLLEGARQLIARV